MATRINVSSYFLLACILMIFAVPSIALSYDINEKFTVEGTLTGVYQYGDYDVEGVDDADRGAVAFDLGVNFHPSESDEFQVTMGFAAGNGLNDVNPFSLVPYAGDLEDDLKDINGRSRDYLLEAWYKHTFKLADNMSLGMTGGIIDAAAYIDDNAFANDETGQFMNEAFVNHRNVNLPSYDLGGVIELNISNFSVRVLAMNTKFESGDGEFTNYNYYSLQAGYALATAMGEGNYRVYGFTTSERFQCPDESERENLQGFGISADQKLGEIVGVFARASWQDDEAVIDHDNVYSGGVNINGKLWGRENDEIGVGYAYLDGACTSDIDHTTAFETYAKFQISTFSDVTLDIQYINDDMKENDDSDGMIYGVRMNAYF
jgi:hypothetical protein